MCSLEQLSPLQARCRMAVLYGARRFQQWAKQQLAQMSAFWPCVLFSTREHVHMFIYLSVCLPIHLSVSLSISCTCLPTRAPAPTTTGRQLWTPMARRGGGASLVLFWRLPCSSFLVMTCCLIGGYTILPKKELDGSLQEAATNLGQLLTLRAAGLNATGEGVTSRVEAWDLHQTVS